MDQPLPTQLVSPAERSAPADWWSQVTAPPTASPVAAFGTGWLIARTFGTWGRNVLRFAPLGLLGNAPMAVAMYLIYSFMPGLMVQRSPPLERIVSLVSAFGGAWLVTVLLYPLILGAIAHGAVQGLRGQSVRVGAMLQAGARSYFRVLLMGFLASLAMIPAALLLVVPAIIPMVGWSASIPAVVVERLGPVRGLGRSWELTRGHRWKVFAGIAVATMAVWLVASLFQGATLAALMLMRGPRGLAPGPAMAIPMGVYQLVGGAVNTVIHVACAAAYHGLRTVKEGGDPETLARVFE